MSGDTWLPQLAALVESGRFTDAVAMFRRRRLPAHPSPLSAWVELSDLLRAQGRSSEAKAVLRDATARHPDFTPAWHRLGLLLHAERESTEASQCARRVTTLAPANPAGWELCAAIEQKRDDPAAAIALCREGLRHAPTAGRLHYSLAQLLRQECSFAEAADAYEAALRHGFDTPELHRNLAEACMEAGDGVRALAKLTAGVGRFPDNALLQRLRAQCHWEYGVPGDALAPLWQAARDRPQNAALWEVLADLLNRLGRNEEVRAALAEARTHGPPTPDLSMLEAIACAAAGENAVATRLFADLTAAHPRHLGARLAFVAHLLSTGDPERAEAMCADILGQDPHVQRAWAYRGTAWRLLEDAREAWLLDYERMVIPLRVPPPADYAGAEAFFRDVRDALETLQRTHAHPIDQTLRGGTQTNGYLFRYKHPVLRKLEQQIRAAVREALEAFPHDAKHPFWGRRAIAVRETQLRFAGAWAVRLRSQGFHTNHIHPQGWISSALYVALPGDMRGDAGNIQFGVPPVEMGLALPAARVVVPEVGALLLFPSYMWHGTVPFASEQPRVTVAFDLLPPR